jgi:hypothetical protein
MFIYPTHMSIKINRLEEEHNSYPLVCRRPAETVSLQRRKICYRWGTPAYWSLVRFFNSIYHPTPWQLKTRLKETIHKAFSHRNYGSNFVVLGYNSTYFSNKIHKGKTCYSEEQVISMLEFLIDNINVEACPSDTGSHNRLDLINDLVQTHYVWNKFI